MQWMYQRGVTDFDGMTDLSKSVRNTHRDWRSSSPVSTPGTIRRTAPWWLFAVAPASASRPSSFPAQARHPVYFIAGYCALDCAFCATGAQGFNRNLDASEIISQVWHANEVLPARERGTRGHECRVHGYG